MKKILTGLYLTLLCLRGFAGCPNYGTTNTQTGFCNQAAGNKTYDQLIGTGTLTVNGDLTINGDFTIVDIVVVNDSLHVTGNLNGTLGGQIRVSGSGMVTVDGNADMSYFGSSVIDGVMVVSGNFENGTSGLADYGTTTVNGALTVGGTFVNSSKGTLAGNGTLTGNVVDSGNSSGFSGTYIGNCSGNCDGTLPVSLISFDGEEIRNGACILYWTTVGEVNNLGFFIDRMETRFESFVPIGFVRGQGTTNERFEYTFADTTFVSGAYYRLRQLDYDGTEDVSEAIFVNKVGPPEGTGFTVWPNPTMGWVTLQGLEDERMAVSLLSPDGREVVNKEAESISAVEKLISDSLTGLPGGIYLLTISDGMTLRKERIIKR